MKQCAKCREIKDESEFRIKTHRSGNKGLNSYCKECCRECTRKYMARARKEYPDKIKESKRKYYIAHQKEIDTKNKEWKDAHPDKAKKWRKESTKEWMKNNRDKVNALHAKYVSNKKYNGGTYTAEEWQSLCDKYGNRCLCCHEKKKLTVDHVIPISKGGLNIISNIQPLCVSCNCKKSNKIIDYRPTAPTY